MSGTPPRKGRPSKDAGKNRGSGSRGTTRGGAFGRPRQPPQPSGPAKDVHVPDGVRLQKVLAQAGVGSRRACEELISAGRVDVDGQRVTELGVRIDPTRQVVHVDGVRIQLDESLVYLAFNKPLGVLSAMSDPQGRPNLGDFVANREERLFHVGRLDADSEGLILLTNDGELANRLSHPRYEVPKTYLVEVAGPVPAGPGQAAARRHRARRRHRLGRQLQGRRRPTRARRCSSSSCTTAATASSGACSPPPGTPSSSSCAPGSGPSASATCARAAAECWGRPRSAP